MDERKVRTPSGAAEAGPEASRRGVVLGLAGLAGLGGAGCALLEPAPPLSAGASAAPKGAPQPRGRLEGEVAFITGAARGIGRATCLACAREGADVVGVDIAGPVSPQVPYPPATPADLEETAALARTLGRRFVPIVADVRDSAALRAAAAQAKATFGRLDVLVANAGIVVPAKLDETDDRQWRDILDVNLIGVANSLRAVMPHMIEQGGGRIVAISSMQGRRGASHSAHYNASKWGVIGLVKSAALELGAEGITVNAICPTAVNTVMFRNAANYAAFSPDELPDNPPERLVARASQRMHPLRVPWIEPEDVAAAVVLLASPEARYVSGAVLDVTAGLGAQYTA